MSLGALTAIAFGAAVQADVFNMGGTRNADGSWTGLASVELVTVGNPGNAGEPSGLNGDCGRVANAFAIGKYEITSAQYAEFLNAVAKKDSYGLYHLSMMYDDHSCQIQRSGVSGSYRYSVASDRANRPVNYVGFWDACRFANWLHQGQPSGDQTASTTEDGAYTLNGMMGSDGREVVRNAGAKWWIPSEDEWYKAAYHKNDGVTGNYWNYATGSDSVPGNDLLEPDPGNSANFFRDDYTIGPPYHTTEVGAFENSESPCGTFDQAGNVAEWNDTVSADGWRGMRGGDWIEGSLPLASHNPWGGYPSSADSFTGFRVAGPASVPRPGDANGDGKVDDLDASILAANWQRTGGAIWAQADFNGDGNVNDLDASILAANWQYGVGAAVPEPAGWALLAGAGVLLALVARRCL